MPPRLGWMLRLISLASAPQLPKCLSFHGDGKSQVCGHEEASRAGLRVVVVGGPFAGAPGHLECFEQGSDLTMEGQREGDPVSWQLHVPVRFPHQCPLPVLLGSSAVVRTPVLRGSGSEE